MSESADLTGHHILVVEDDYHLATDAASTLRAAGAAVIGPCPTEESARAAIAATAFTGAVLDINLRGGRSFDLAREFKAQGTPFLFITGYDEDVIPDEFVGVTRLQKPVQPGEIVGALGQALGATA